MKIMTFNEVLTIALFALVALVLIFMLALDSQEEKRIRAELLSTNHFRELYNPPTESFDSSLRTQHRQGSGATLKDSPDEKPNAPREDDAS